MKRNWKKPYFIKIEEVAVRDYVPSWEMIVFHFLKMKKY